MTADFIPEDPFSPDDAGDLEPRDPDEDGGLLVVDPAPVSWTAADSQPVEFSLRPSA